LATTLVAAAVASAVAACGGSTDTTTDADAATGGCYGYYGCYTGGGVCAVFVDAGVTVPDSGAGGGGGITGGDAAADDAAYDGPVGGICK
jgi:hypothetical protein